MQEKALWRTKGYIFPKIIRQSYFIYGRISMIAFFGFIIFFFVMAIKQETDQSTAWCVVAFFCVLYIYLVIVWVRNRKLLKATYCIDHQAACNTTENNENITISLQKAVQSEYTYKFYFFRASMDEEYVIFSTEAICSLPSSNIYKAIREVWKSDAVIIPKMAVEIKAKDRDAKT